MHASLRRPKELFNSSPGFYMALGDREPAPQSRIVRLYFDVSPSAAVGLTREITGRFNADGLAFRLKVLNDVGAFTRCDCMVLYVGQEDFPDVRCVLEGLYPSLESRLRGRTPALTRVLAPGIGLAEDPPGGQSFGLHRCALVADGLIDAWEAKASNSGERLAIVAAHFEREGVDIDAPYRGAASSADYSFKPLTTAARASHAAGDCGSPYDFLRAAEDIARGLIGKALWHRHCCNWLGSTPADTIHSASPAARIFAALGPDLYLGTSGIALFLAALWRATGREDRRLQRTAMGAIRHALLRIPSLGPRDTLGLYTGRMGILLACARVGYLLESDELLERAAALSEQPFDSSAKDLPFDLMSGRAGAIIALLSLRALRTRSDPVELAARLGDEIIAGAQQCQGGWAWPSHASTQRRFLTGYSHGVAGIGASLLELFRHTKERRYRHAAEQAFRYERRWFNAEKGNWVDLRDNDGKREHFGEFGYPAQWCHGAPGIALSRLRAHAILEDEACLAEARIALATTQRSVESALRDGQVNYSLCHGIAGNADVLLIGASALDDGGSQAIATAKTVGSVGLSRFGKGGSPWPLGARGEVPGVMLGLAGIGHFYLRLFDSSVPSFLLWQPEELSKEDTDHAPEAPADARAGLGGVLGKERRAGGVLDS
jgi:hypothetical protein